MAVHRLGTHFALDVEQIELVASHFAGRNGNRSAFLGVNR